MWTYNYQDSNELFHHGVKGMKWGVRRAKRQEARLEKKATRKEAKLEKKAARKASNLEKKPPAKLLVKKCWQSRKPSKLE